MRAVVAALLFGCLVAAPAEAQFGLGKRIKNAAASAAYAAFSSGLRAA